MANLRVEKPRNFIELMKLIERVQSLASNPLWFRGCGLDTHKLLPTLYRHKTQTSVSQIEKLENDLITKFRQRSVPFHSRPMSDDWDTLFFMQHYGVPTRLLDWSESPFVGLFFAAMSSPTKVLKPGNLKFLKPAAIWILDPVEWNRHSLKHISFDGKVLATGDEAVKGYRPTNSFSNMFNEPVGLYGTHNSARIVAQRGVFTIFGRTTKPMEEVYVKNAYPKDCLIKVILTKVAMPNIRETILRHAITESVVFPDLDGLSKEIRRTFGF